MVGKRAPLLHLPIRVGGKLVGGGRFGQREEIHATHVRGLGEPCGCRPGAYAGHTHTGISQFVRHRFRKRSYEAFDAKYIAIYGPAIIEATEEMFNMRP